MTIDIESLPTGARLPDFLVPPISRAALALYAGASGDHNPVHIDIDVARKAGYPDVFAQGMLVMAHLARSLTRLAPQHGLRSYSARFVGITPIGTELVCSAVVKERLVADGERRVRLALSVSARGDAQDVKITGEAVVAFP